MAPCRFQLTSADDDTGAIVFLLGALLDDFRDAAAQAVYVATLRNLLFFRPKLANSYGPQRATIDEIVLHGTESTGTQEQSATYLQGATAIHYFIGRDSGLAYLIVPDDYQSFHAGNPKHHKNVQDHNPKSIGIEMYQQDISVFKNDVSKLAMLCYHLCHKWNIARSNIVGHGEVNPVDRSPNEPRNFDWDRFNGRLDDLSKTLSGLLGSDFALSP